MSDIDEIVSVTVTFATSSVSRQGFTIPLIAGYTTAFTGIRTYNASTMLSSLVTDGIAATTPIYLAAQAMLSQTPRPKKIKVGALSTSWTQTVNLVPTTANSTTYNGSVNGQPWTFTSDSSATLAEVCTGIAAAITALTGVTATGVSGTQVVVTVDAAATLVPFAHGTGAGVYTLTDVTDRTDIATGLTALRAADKDWYGFVIDSAGTEDIKDAAAWAETQLVAFMPTTMDDATKDPASTTDLGYLLKASGYKRTYLFYNEDVTDFLGAATLATVLPYQPGTVTLYYRSPAGPAVSSLSATAEGALSAKNVNWVSETAEQRITLDGRSAGGSYYDNIAAVDWVTSRVKEDLFAWLTSGTKKPYEDKSVKQAEDVISGVLNQGMATQPAPIIASDPAPFVEGPLVADVSPTDRASRLLPDVFFSFRLSGGIKTIEVQGVASL